MARINLANNKGSLVKLSDSDLQLHNEAEDIRGRRVVDSTGEEIGEVNDLFVDERDARVRFVEVGSGGFLGMGERTFLIPVDALTNVTEDEIMIGHKRDKLAGAPPYNPSLVDERYLNQTYGFFGTQPFWSPDYKYPSYPRYKM